MRPAEKALVHQVHPAKIGMDVTASVISNILLWRGRPKAALAARAVLPAAGSLAVLAMADLDALAATRRGQYVLAHMPPSAQALRLAGDALMGWAAHRRRVTLLVAGAAVIAAGWSHAAWRRTYTWQRSPPPGCRHPHAPNTSCAASPASWMPSPGRQACPRQPGVAPASALAASAPSQQHEPTDAQQARHDAGQAGDDQQQCADRLVRRGTTATKPNQADHIKRVGAQESAPLRNVIAKEHSAVLDR